MTPHQTLTKHSDPGTALPLHFNALIHELDRRRRGRFGILLGGQSPWAALQAWEDWAFHLMLSSGKQIELCELALESASSLYRSLLTGEAQDGDAGSLGIDGESASEDDELEAAESEPRVRGLVARGPGDDAD